MGFGFANAAFLLHLEAHALHPDTSNPSIPSSSRPDRWSQHATASLISVQRALLVVLNVTPFSPRVCPHSHFSCATAIETSTGHFSINVAISLLLIIARRRPSSPRRCENPYSWHLNNHTPTISLRIPLLYPLDHNLSHILQRPLNHRLHFVIFDRRQIC